MNNPDHLRDEPDISSLAPVPLKRCCREETFPQISDTRTSSKVDGRDALEASAETLELTGRCASVSKIRARSSVTGKSQEEKWYERYEELQVYKKINGDTYVPVNHPTLGRWAATQRTNYQLLRDGKPHAKINMKRVNLLQEIGFCFDTYDARWEENLKDLIIYREKYGHCNVPRSFAGNSNIKGMLGSWVRRQRSIYKQYLENKLTSLNKKKISKLEALGFHWYCSEGTRLTSDTCTQVENESNVNSIEDNLYFLGGTNEVEPTSFVEVNNED